MKQKHLFLILVAVLALFIAWINLDSEQQSTIENPKNQMLLRKIGDEVLKSSNDSTSKVLPIKIISPNEFQIRFENKFSFSPDSLVAIVQSNMERSTFPQEYVVNVLKCTSKEIVYGFLISVKEKEEIIPCTGRKMSGDCYSITIKLIPTSSIFFNYKTLFFIFLLLVFAVLFWYIFNRKKEKLVQHKESNKIIQIGKYFFYYEQHYVEYEDLKIVLTSKESKLLYIFFTSPDEVIDRNILQKEVWENEGVIVTRSLDMFISKLRKKLNKDPLVNIVNIHGIGYKLEINLIKTTKTKVL